MGASTTLVFGMMRAAGQDMAIAADVIQEVVAWPERITLPLRSSETIRGLFDLRGQVVPIVEMGRLMGSDGLSAGSGNVAILRTPKGRIGLAVDSIGGILRVTAEQVQGFAGASSEATLMRGLLRASGDRIIPILDVTSLAALPGMLFLQAEDAAQADTTTQAASTYLVFTCGAFRFCVDATCVREIIDTPQIERAAMRIDLYRGVAPVRGGVAAVVDLLPLLAMPDRGIASTKLLVLEQGAAVMALAITDIVAIQRRKADDVLSMPAFGAARRDLIVGLLAGAAPEDPDVIVLSHPAILADRAVSAIRSLHSDIVRASAQTSTRKAYLKVEAGHAFYVKLSQCAEIIVMPERSLRAGPTDAAYLGLLRRGAETWPLIRLRAMLAGSDVPAPGSERVLLVRGAGALFGFVVDAVQAIEYLAVRDDLGSTPATGATRNAAMGAAASNIWIDSPQGPHMHMVLDLEALAEQLAATGAGGSGSQQRAPVAREHDKVI